MHRVIGLLLLNCYSLAAAQTLTPEVRKFVTVDAPVIALTHVRAIDGTGRQRGRIRLSSSVRED